jgi:hypothetical protein
MIAMLRSPALLLLMLGFFALAPGVAYAEATPAQDERLKEIIAGDQIGGNRRGKCAIRETHSWHQPTAVVLPAGLVDLAPPQRSGALCPELDDLYERLDRQDGSGRRARIA